MRSRFLLMPAAIIAAAPVVAPVAAHADDLISVEQAQKLLFPGATLTPADYTMSEAEVDQLLQKTGIPVYRSKVRAWKASTGGYFFVDQVLGRDDRVTYALAIEADGSVKGIEIVVGLPQYGAVITKPWQAHFKGLREGQPQPANIIVSGQTLTCQHVADGIARLLATYEMFIAPKAKT